MSFEDMTKHTPQGPVQTDESPVHVELWSNHVAMVVVSFDWAQAIAQFSSAQGWHGPEVVLICREQLELAAYHVVVVNDHCHVR